MAHLQFSHYWPKGGLTSDYFRNLKMRLRLKKKVLSPLLKLMAPQQKEGKKKGLTTSAHEQRVRVVRVLFLVR